MIPSEIIKKIKGIELRTRLVVSTLFSGNYHSTFKGQGIDFSEIREYQAGDDVRLIDWKNTEKMNTPYCKVFEEERDLTVILAVDLSASNRFTSQEKSKQDIILEIASILGFSATQNKDKVGLLLFTDSTECYIPPKKGKNHMLRILRDIYFYKPKSKKTNISNAIKTLLKHLRKKSIVFLISDFIDSDFEYEMKKISQKHDLIPIIINDPWEKSLPEAGHLLFEDHESGELLQIQTNKTQLDTYKNISLSQHTALHRLFNASQCKAIHVFSDQDYILALRQYFKYRKTSQS